MYIYVIVSILDKGTIKLKVSLPACDITVQCVYPTFQRCLKCMVLFSGDSCTVVRASCLLCAHSSGNMQINTNAVCNATSVSAHSLGIR